MATTRPKLLTADDLLQLYSKGVRGELIRGVLCETMAAGGEHGEIVMNLGGELRNFIKARKLGRLFGSVAGVRLERDPDVVREPDIAYISAEKLPPDTRVTGFYETAPDLVVEVASPGNSYGVRLVWVVHPDTRIADVHCEGYRVLSLSDQDKLDGLDILPGFTCAVSEIFET